MAGDILTLNVGSSSVKVALFAAGGGDKPAASASVIAVGTPQATLLTCRDGDRAEERRPVDAGDAAAATRATLDALTSGTRPPAAVAHRIVHGGPRHTAPQVIDAQLLADLDTLTAWAPHHLPPSLAAIRIAREVHPNATHVACFDTAFHATLPPVAQRYPLPQRFLDAGIRRYGFHGLSCESVLHALATLDPAAAERRIVIAHLGSGASLTAVSGGRSIETTMGFSPMGGIMMSTRTGDLDPGVLLHLLEHHGLNVAGVRRLVSHEAGLFGVSGSSADMATLLAAESADPAARDAVALFCHLGRQAIGSLVAVLGGLDLIVFTGGIGEHAPSIRARLADLPFLRVQIDSAANALNAPLISASDSAVSVRVIPSDEARVLAAYARQLLKR